MPDKSRTQCGIIRLMSQEWEEYQFEKSHGLSNKLYFILSMAITVLFKQMRRNEITPSFDLFAYLSNQNWFPL